MQQYYPLAGSKEDLTCQLLNFMVNKICQHVQRWHLISIATIPYQAASSQWQSFRDSLLCHQEVWNDGQPAVFIYLCKEIC